MTRPILLGMNNPLSRDPAHALYPHPPGCTGHRLYEMLREVRRDLTKKQYCEMFDRRNLLGTAAWKQFEARLAADTLVADITRGIYQGTIGRSPDVFVLGAKTWSAFLFDQSTEWLGRASTAWGVFWKLPHPSGRNRWYNNQTNRRQVASLMLDKADQAR